MCWALAIRIAIQAGKISGRKYKVYKVDKFWCVSPARENPK